MSDEIVEVPKSRLAVLENVHKLSNLIWNDEKIGMAVKERYKELVPNANVPEVVVAQSTRKLEQDLIAKVEAKEKAVDEKIANWEKTQKDREEKDTNKRAEEAFSREVDATKRKYQLTPEGMEKVFARMKEKNNPDVEAAAAWVTDHEPKAPITNSSYAPQSLNPFGASKETDDTWLNALNKDPFSGKAFDQRVAEMVDDFNTGNQGKYREFGGTL